MRRMKKVQRIESDGGRLFLFIFFGYFVCLEKCIAVIRFLPGNGSGKGALCDLGCVYRVRPFDYVISDHKYRTEYLVVPP